MIYVFTNNHKLNTIFSKKHAMALALIIVVLATAWLFNMQPALFLDGLHRILGNQPQGSESIQPINGMEKSYSEEELSVLPEQTIIGFDLVSPAYFEKVLFIGDSLTHGLNAYNIIPQASFLTAVGSGLASLEDGFNYIDETTGETLNLLQAISLHEPAPAYIYIMMGSNGLNWLSFEYLLEKYHVLVNHCQEIFPDALIVIQSVTPTSDYIEYTQPGLSRDNIMAYNKELVLFSEQQGLFFLDVFTYLASPEGYLPLEAGSGDGIHFSSSFYQKWYDFLLANGLVELETILTP